ncbi:hypothetical protein ACFVRR_24105 [Gottfriedia sp. NPDC057948]|uniref:hypothetical protein n=1 Tax=Gottfriedia sp. NPDC057948 TaxID=3346287 RepID=UPI0036DC77F8
MNIEDKVEYLNKLRADMSEEQYRIVAANILTKYYVDVLHTNSIERNRMYVLNKVNEVLHHLDIEEVGYSVIRKFL